MSREFLALIIEKSGLTKKEFAADLGLHSHTVDKWLAGLFKPSAENQEKIRLKHKNIIAKLYK